MYEALLKLPDVFAFDLDGNLTQTSPAAARLSSITDKWDVPLTSLVFKLMKAAQNTYRMAGIHSEICENFKKNVLDILSREQQDAFRLLASACERNIHCSLVSNGPREWGEKTIDRLSLRPFFDQMFFREDTGYLKPDPRTLLPIIDQNAEILGEKGTVWVMGDRATDMQLALNTDKICSHDIIPVAIKGTPAAEYLSISEEFNGKGYVFESMNQLASLIDPGMEERLDKACNVLEWPEHVLTLNETAGTSHNISTYLLPVEQNFLNMPKAFPETIASPNLK